MQIEDNDFYVLIHLEKHRAEQFYDRLNKIWMIPWAEVEEDLSCRSEIESSALGDSSQCAWRSRSMSPWIEETWNLLVQS